MQLLRLRLVNFRQHADTELEFGPGITGIIGPNGSGKTSILEAIAWALYGVQAALGKTERAAFLSRVLGYERLREAQERVREVRNGVAAEVRGLEAGLPDGAALAAARQAAEQRLSGARRSAKSADAARRAAEDALGREEPRWNEWMARRERTLSLDRERRMAGQGGGVARPGIPTAPKGGARRRP